MNEKEAREYISALQLKRAEIGKLYDPDRDRKDQPYTTKEYLILKLLEHRKHRDPSLEDPSWLVFLTIDELRILNSIPVGQNCEYKTTRECYEKMLKPYKKVSVPIFLKTEKMLIEYCEAKQEHHTRVIHDLVEKLYNKWKEKRTN